MHHLLLPQYTRREVMQNQISMSYRAYIFWLLEAIKEANRTYVNSCWKSRTDDDYKSMKEYATLTTNLEAEVAGFKRMDRDE